VSTFIHIKKDKKNNPFSSKIATTNADRISKTRNHSLYPKPRHSFITNWTKRFNWTMHKR